MKKIILKTFFKLLKHNQYDINLDGQVDSKDLFDLKKYILESESENNG